MNWFYQSFTAGMTRVPHTAEQIAVIAKQEIGRRDGQRMWNEIARGGGDGEACEWFYNGAMAAARA